MIVVALSAFAGAEEEADAIQAGCSGCISKPVDTRHFAQQVRDFLERRAFGAASGGSHLEPLSESALLPLRARFLQESAGQAKQWSADLDGDLDAESAAQAVHQWIGAAGLLGYPELSEMARDLAAAFRARPVDTGELRQSLDELLRAVTARLAEQKPEP